MADISDRYPGADRSGGAFTLGSKIEVGGINRPMPRREHPTFYIWSPEYTRMHSGVICLHLLCHHLNRLGYQAYITGGRSPGRLRTRYADKNVIQTKGMIGPRDIVIYPEVVAGNPLGGKRVVRYLLNRPGRVSGIGMNDYGPNDYFIHFADEFRPDGVQSRRLWIPLVDRSIYGGGSPRQERKEFLIYSGRREPNLGALPEWVSPFFSLISRKAPREPEALAALYRDGRALAVGERTAAINEAIQCGCPVILMQNPDFEHERIIRWYLGCGVTVGWGEAGLARAERTVRIAKTIYRLRGLGLNFGIRRFVRESNNYFTGLAIRGGKQAQNSADRLP